MQNLENKSKTSQPYVECDKSNNNAKFQHIVSPISYLVKCYCRIVNCIISKAKNRNTMCHVINTFILSENAFKSSLRSLFCRTSLAINYFPFISLFIPKIPKMDTKVNTTIESNAGWLFFKSIKIGYVCTARIAPPIYIINFSKLFKSLFVTTLSKDAFKACTCAFACLSGTPLVTKSSYTCKVSICAIVNHLIKSVSNTISKLLLIVNTFLLSFFLENKVNKHKENDDNRSIRVGFSFNFCALGNLVTCIFTGFHSLFLHQKNGKYTPKKKSNQIQRKAIKRPMAACALIINWLACMLRGFHKKAYCGNLCKMSYKTFAIQPIPKRRKLSLTFIHPNLYFSAKSLNAIFKSFLVTYSSCMTRICSVFIKSLISLKVLSSSWIMSKSPLDHLLTKLSHILPNMSTREVLSWQ